MSAPFKHFSALKSLHAQLKAEEEARQAEQAERARQELERQREANLFRASVGEVKPISHGSRVLWTPQPPLPVAHQHMADEQAALQESLSDEFTIETLMDSDETLSYARHGIGGDVLRKLRSGRWVIQAQLDLHGLRTDEAREAVSEFIRNATRRGLRCVRVVHGKGLGSVNKEPVLKGKVRNWLVQKEEILAFCQARPVDGGAGALIVLLKAHGRD